MDAVGLDKSKEQMAISTQTPARPVGGRGPWQRGEETYDGDLGPKGAVIALLPDLLLAFLRDVLQVLDGLLLGPAPAGRLLHPGLDRALEPLNTRHAEVRDKAVGDAKVEKGEDRVDADGPPAVLFRQSLDALRQGKLIGSRLVKR